MNRGNGDGKNVDPIIQLGITVDETVYAQGFQPLRGELQKIGEHES
jgi:hypothetical protein